MPKEKQVSSLKLSRKLKELGVKQESYFKYAIALDGLDDNKNVVKLINPNEDYKGYYDLYVSAFTVAELGEMLPMDFSGGGDCQLFMDKSSNQYRVWYADLQDDLYPLDFTHSQIADTEAAARAKMLIYLLENKLITL